MFGISPCRFKRQVLMLDINWCNIKLTTRGSKTPVEWKWSSKQQELPSEENENVEKSSVSWTIHHFSDSGGSFYIKYQKMEWWLCIYLGDRTRMAGFIHDLCTFLWKYPKSQCVYRKKHGLLLCIQALYIYPHEHTEVQDETSDHDSTCAPHVIIVPS